MCNECVKTLKMLEDFSRRVAEMRILQKEMLAASADKARHHYVRHLHIQEILTSLKPAEKAVDEQLATWTKPRFTGETE